MPPKVLHYGLDWKIGKTGFEFDKHWFYDFNALQCPPWKITNRSKGGLFEHPPHPSLYATKACPLLALISTHLMSVRFITEACQRQGLHGRFPRAGL